MNLLHLISSSGFFGAERVVCELCRCSVAPGLTMHIAVLTRDEGLLASFKKAVNRPEVDVIGIPCSGRLDVKAVKALKRIIADRQIDILHSHGYKSDFYALILKNICRRPLALFATNHNWIGLTINEKVYQAIDALALRRFARIVAVSEQVKRDMTVRSIPPSRIEVIGNGIDPEDPDLRGDRAAARQGLGLNDDDLVIGNVARLTAEKDHARLIEAVATLRPDVPNIRLIIVGDGPERAALEELARQKHLGDAARFTGNTDNARRCYAAFDMFALPSLNEGLPMVLLEAMAAGVPVIASSVGAVPRVVQHGKNGLLISPGDTAQLVQAMRRLAADPTLRAELSRQGAETVRNDFSSHAMVRRYWEIYEDGSRRTAYGAGKRQNSERVTAEGVGEKGK
jgi:glycosyltransferase involved in cell wall biosynthesis